MRLTRVKIWREWMLVCGLAGACVAQAPVERRAPAEAQVPLFKSQARLVTVPVNAVDAKGAPVGGLARGDFKVLEDGKEQTIAFFEKESATPLEIVMAIDGSGSVLRDERLEKEAARKFVKTLLRPQDALDVMEFSDSVQELVSFTNDQHAIEDGLNRLVRGDATAVYDAVYLASQRLGETPAGGGRRRVLLMITDGGDTVHGTQYPQAVEAAQRAGVAIYALIVVPIYADAGRNEAGEHALEQMAEDTGGKYFFVETAKDLAPAFAKVSDDLRTQYVLGYYAPEGTVKSRKDGYRAVTVETTEPGMSDTVQLRYRTGYYAAK